MNFLLTQRNSKHLSKKLHSFFFEAGNTSQNFKVWSPAPVTIIYPSVDIAK